MKPKRRNLTRWQENRLRRLDYKLKTYVSNPNGTAALYTDCSDESMARCRDRAGELANAIQIAWAKREGDKIHADLSGQPC